MTKKNIMISSDDLVDVLKAWILIVEEAEHSIKLMNEKEIVMNNYIHGREEYINVMEMHSISSFTKRIKSDIDKGIRISNNLRSISSEHFEPDFDFSLLNKLDEIIKYVERLKKQLSDKLKAYELQKETVLYYVSKNGCLELDFIDITKHKGR